MTGKKGLSGSMGRCSHCKTPIKKGDEWHFVQVPSNPSCGKDRQHYDCKNPKERY